MRLETQHDSEFAVRYGIISNGCGMETGFGKTKNSGFLSRGRTGNFHAKDKNEAFFVSTPDNGFPNERQKEGVFCLSPGQMVSPPKTKRGLFLSFKRTRLSFVIR
jgi:hypothetical protein